MRTLMRAFGLILVMGSLLLVSVGIFKAKSWSIETTTPVAALLLGGLSMIYKRYYLEITGVAVFLYLSVSTLWGLKSDLPMAAACSIVVLGGFYAIPVIAYGWELIRVLSNSKSGNDNI